MKIFSQSGQELHRHLEAKMQRRQDQNKSPENTEISQFEDWPSIQSWSHYHNLLYKCIRWKQAVSKVSFGWYPAVVIVKPQCCRCFALVQTSSESYFELKWNVFRFVLCISLLETLHVCIPCKFTFYVLGFF